jgi:hypothetical protein
MSSPIWQIDTLSVSNTNGLVDVVVTAFWRVNARDGEHTGTAYGGVSLDPPTPGAFANFDALTEAQVLGWVKAKLDVAATEAAALASLEAVRNPPTRYKAPAWSNAGGAGKAKGKANG